MSKNSHPDRGAPKSRSHLLLLLFILSSLALAFSSVTNKELVAQEDDLFTFLPLISQESDGPEEPSGGGSEDLLPPRDFADLLDYNVNLGVWSYHDGMVQILSFLDEALEFEELPNSSLIAKGELNRLTQEVRTYLAGLPVGEEKTEIETLASRVYSDFTHAANYSVPFPADGSEIPDLPSDERCLELWRSGFPAGGDEICFASISVNEEGVRTTEQTPPLTIEMPSKWAGKEEYQIFKDVAFAAAQDSIAVFSTYPNGLPPIHIYFKPATKTKKSKSADDLAEADINNGVCLITIFQEATNQIKTTGSAEEINRSIEKFGQTVAHEIFHCYQHKNLKPRMLDKKRSDWWVEGTAEYFSNVIYPRGNDEYRMAEYYQTASMRTSITDTSMNYDTFLFWQYLGNSIGDDQIIAMLYEMPSSGDSDTQARALASMENGNMDMLWHNFAEQYVDQAIVDTGSGVHYPDPKEDLNRELVFTKTKQPKLEAGVRAFTVPRMKLTYTEKLFFEQMHEDKGDSKSTVREWEKPGTWGPFQDYVSACPRQIDHVWVSTTTNAEEDQVVTFEVEKGDEDRCTCFVQLEINGRTYFSSQASYINIGSNSPINVTGGDPFDFVVQFPINDLTPEEKRQLTLLSFQDQFGTVGYLDAENGSAEIELSEVIDHYISGEIAGQMLFTPIENATEQLLPFTLDFRAGQNFIPGICASP